MTIAAIGTRGTEAGQHSVPVATEQLFAQCWLPGALALGLQLIPMLRSPGLDVDATNRDAVVTEIDRLVDWARRHASAFDREHLLQRAALLRELLMRIESPTLECVCIG